MIDDQLVLSVERLRDDLAELKRDLRQKYKQAQQQVTSPSLRVSASRIAENWMVTVAQREDVLAAIGTDCQADLTVRFQRILTYSEHATTRGKYDAEIAAILRDFTVNVVIPLKQSRGKATVSVNAANPVMNAFRPTAFVGHSFAPADELVASSVIGLLKGIGITVETGERPKAAQISEKVKKLIEQQYVFVGIFTRRDKLHGKNEYTTSAWVIDEKAYAYALGKKLILLREDGIESIGGIQGDYEFIPFDRTDLHLLLGKVVELFELSVSGIRSQ